MKFSVPYLKTGDQFQAKIIEVLAQDRLIVSVQGDLLQVRNESARNFQAGEHVQVRVSSVNPLQLELSQNPRHLGRLQRSV